VDLFAEASAQFNFSEAVDAVIAAYRGTDWMRAPRRAVRPSPG
jgi:hypothetical protein